MKKRIILYSVIFLVLLLGVILYVSIFMHRNEKLEITMKSNGGVPYKWIYEIEDKSIVKCTKSYVVNENNDLDGGYKDINFVFKGLKKGKTKVTFKYVSITDENNVSKTNEFTLKVDAKKSVSLVALDN